jgi:F-type H+-transporting ATPase subunit delta
MKVANRKLKSFTSRLLTLSQTGGRVDPEKVKTVLSTLMNSDIHNLRQVLVIYRQQVAQDLKRSTAILSHAGPLSPGIVSGITSALEEKTGRRLEVEVREDPQLIAGIQVAIGDYVFERSIRSILQQLSSTI